MDKDKLAQLLQASQVPNTEQVKAATAQLQKDFYPHHESLLLLIEIALTHTDTAVRQLAAVQASRLVPKHWQHTPEAQKPLARSHLLDGALAETSAGNRHSLARLVAGIVGVDMELKQGDDFVKKLLPLNNSDNVVAREVASYILFAMIEEDPTHFTENTHQLLELFQARIGDPDSKEVRINIVQAIGAFLVIVEADGDPQATEALRAFVPAIVGILKTAVEANEEESYSPVFDVLHSFMACDPALLGPHLGDLLHFMIEMASNTGSDADDEARTQALGFLVQCVRYRRMKVQAIKDMGAQLMIKAMHIVTDLDVDDDEDDMTPARTALGLIDTLAHELPPRQVIVPLLDQFPSFAASQEPGFRIAAIMALGDAAEGAPDFISTQLQPLLPTVVALLCDQDDGVRHAALIGLIHLAEEMADDMASHHQQILSAVLSNLEAASQGTPDKKKASIIRCACGALDSLGEGVDTEIMAQFGPNLMNPMVRLLDHEDSSVKAAAASAIGAIASSMEKTFQPYFEDVMKALGRFVTIQDTSEAIDLRSSTCDSLGRVAMAVGPEAFQPYVMALMEASEQALSLDNPRLKETSFILWSNLSKVYGEQFEHFLDGAIAGLFASLDLEEEEVAIPGGNSDLANGASIIVGGKRVKVMASDEEDAAVANGDDDWDDLDDFGDFGTVTAVALEQEIALDVLGDVISNSCNSTGLEKYAEKVMTKVLPFSGHTYEGCRKTAIVTLWRTYARVFQVWEQTAGVKWQPGMPPTPTPPPSIISMAQELYKATMNVWSEDPERAVITEINRNVAATLKGCGPAVLVSKEAMLQELVTTIGLILTRSHPCQQDVGDEEEQQEVDVGSSEYDWLVIDTALDVVVGLAAALGSAFGELWKIFEKPILKLASSTEELHRSTAVGTIAEAIKHAGEAMSPYTDSLGQALGRRLTDPDGLTKSNAAYAMGLLVLYTNDAKVSALLPQLWEKVEPLLSAPGMRMADNAAGCLARMMMRHSNPEFVAEALPAVVRVLPLKEDFEENEPVYKCIHKLYEAGNQTVQQLTPQLLEIFEKVVAQPDDQLDDETRNALRRTLQLLYTAQPDLIAARPSLMQLATTS